MPVQLSGGGGGEHEEEGRIEIVPLIDIMFFLLASFMLVSLSMTQLNRVPLNLPQSSTSVPEQKTPPVHIAIDAAGVVTWDTHVVTLSEITDRLKQMPKADTKVMIGSDQETKHKQFIQVMDAVRAAGIEKISIETKSSK